MIPTQKLPSSLRQLILPPLRRLDHPFPPIPNLVVVHRLGREARFRTQIQTQIAGQTCVEDRKFQALGLWEARRVRQGIGHGWQVKALKFLKF